MSDEIALKTLLRNVFEEQKFGVLSTHDQGQPYATLVAFIANNEFDIIFATTRTTRKYRQISADSRAAMLIDNRKNSVFDIANAVAITGSGEVEELKEEEKKQSCMNYIEKHPNLSEFVKAPSTAMLKLKVAKFTVVSQFQFVSEWFK
jgi:nitroimidazol reductase NimA-like FMN-containing flavoprotein (pyridoxamine 5'-phosphate oxidase superfamily)